MDLNIVDKKINIYIGFRFTLHHLHTRGTFDQNGGLWFFWGFLFFFFLDNFELELKIKTNQ